MALTYALGDKVWAKDKRYTRGCRIQEVKIIGEYEAAPDQGKNWYRCVLKDGRSVDLFESEVYATADDCINDIVERIAYA